jgi:CMP-N-acetylneuraminic acid synthetase
MKNNILFIPMRSKSKTLKDKNIMEIGGQPLFKWFLDAAAFSNIEKIILGVDSEDYKKIIRNVYDGENKIQFYDRLPDNAQDGSTTEDVVLEFINRYPVSEDVTFVLGQITNPFVTTADINNMLQFYQQTDKYKSLISVSSMDGRFFWKEDKRGFARSINYDYRNRPLRQNYEQTKSIFMENGALYINRTKNILQSQNRLTPPVGLYVMQYHTHLELDDEFDKAAINALLWRM